MLKSALLAAVFISTPALCAESSPDAAELSKCPPIGQTAKGEKIFKLDCAAINNASSTDFKPDMPATNLKETVIPKPGEMQSPDTTPTKGENR